jgi:catechol 2,3-dioxygenase-like lactoylglutathione lyase family enzyme
MESDNSLPALTPQLNVRDLTKSLDFYVHLLGFAVQFERIDEGFAAITLGGASLMLEQIDMFDEVSDREFVEDRKWITGKLEHPFGRGLNVQIHVTDLDVVYNRLLKSNYPIKFPMEERWYRVNSQMIGVRQFMVMDPDGFLLRFDKRIGCKPIEGDSRKAVVCPIRSGDSDRNVNHFSKKPANKRLQPTAPSELVARRG